jgi:hypothetical protein
MRFAALPRALQLQSARRCSDADVARLARTGTRAPAAATLVRRLRTDCAHAPPALATVRDALRADERRPLPFGVGEWVRDTARQWRPALESEGTGGSMLRLQRTGSTRGVLVDTSDAHPVVRLLHLDDAEMHALAALCRAYPPIESEYRSRGACAWQARLDSRQRAELVVALVALFGDEVQVLVRPHHELRAPLGVAGRTRHWRWQRRQPLGTATFAAADTGARSKRRASERRRCRRKRNKRIHSSE